MRTLKLSTDSFDQDNSFTILVRNEPVKCSLHVGFDKADDGIYWALNAGTCIKDKYSEADINEALRLIGEGPIENGETVCIEGKLFTCVVHPRRASDQAVFKPV